MKRFSEISEKLEAEGYRKTELTISITAASLITILAGIPLLILSIMLFHRINGIWGFSLGTGNTASFLILMLVLTVVHELMHGAAWSLFCENGWKDIEFGFIVKSLTPYCTCASPLPKWSYIMGAMTPLFVLGVVPYMIGLFSGNLYVLFMAVVMILGAGGDIMLVIRLLRFRSESSEVLVYDHPTEAGSVVFEK
ncbi:MAG: DUF3267 domain-containing protein [Oscillospiraceae bacterium]|nr:DUF3267 domain-containing protein [Oscillospiraceae bacterium]